MTNQPVLDRNQTTGIWYNPADRVAAIPLPTGLGQQPVQLDTPYEYPANTNRPWGLVTFYFKQVARTFDRWGQQKQPPRGPKHGAYLKGASVLLASCRRYVEGHPHSTKDTDDYVIELACRCISWFVGRCGSQENSPNMDTIAMKFAEFVKEVVE